MSSLVAHNYTESKRKIWIFSTIAGISMMLCYSPFIKNLEWLLAIISVSLWCHICLSKDLKFRHLFVFNAIKWLSIFWIWHPLHNLVGLSATLSIIAVICLGLLMSVSYSLINFITLRLTQRFNKEIIAFLVLPIAWLLCEMWAMHIYHFPWLSILATQANAPYRFLFYYFNPTYMVLFLVLFASCINHFFVNKRLTPLLLCSFVVIFYAGYEHYIVYPNRIELDVTAIQINVDKIKQHHEIMRSKKIHEKSAELDNKNLDNYLIFSSSAKKSDLIIWPENVIGSDLSSIDTSHIHKINTLLERHKNIIFGATYLTSRPHNISVLMNKNIDYIEKSHHVPFAEDRYPTILVKIVEFLSVRLSPYNLPHHKNQAFFTIIKDKYNINTQPLICYDTAYHIYEKPDHNIDLYVIQSENVWFDSPWANKQQLMNAQMIANNSKKPVIYAVNAGNIGFISDNGKNNLTQSTLQYVKSGRLHVTYH